MPEPVPPMSHINNYTVTFNFPWEVITVLSWCISITLSPSPSCTQHLHYISPPSFLSPLSHLSSFLHLSTTAHHHSCFILSASVTFFLSPVPKFPHSLLLIGIVSLCLLTSLSCSLALPSSCAMAGSCDVIYPTYCVAMTPLKPMAVWVNRVPHGWRIHQ